VDPLFYAYLGGNLVLYAAGCIWQYRRLKEYLRLQKELKGSTASSVKGSMARRGSSASVRSSMAEKRNNSPK